MTNTSNESSSGDTSTPIRAVIYGVGAVGQLMAKLLLENGIRLVGAIGHKTNVGRDLGEVIGLGHPLGLIISADAEAVLGSAQANIVVLTVGETVEQTLPHLERCVRHGCNVISLSEQLFYPWNCAAELSARIDGLAREHHVTVTAGGMQDVYWVNLPAVASAASSRITAIEGVSLVNGDVFGPAVAKECFIGEAPAAFNTNEAEQQARANVFTIALEALAADLQLAVTDWTQSQRPIVATTAVPSDAIGRVIEPGQIQGMITASRVTTREGIVLTGEVHLKIFAKTDSDLTEWKITGEPNVKIQCPDTGGYVATGATILNRLRDVIDAEPGLVTIDRLSKPKFKVRF